MKTFWILFSGFSIVFLISLSTAAAGSGNSYRLRIAAEDTRELFVQARLRLEDDRLFMAPYGAEQWAARWAHFVKDLSVRDAKTGNPYQVERLPDAQWKVVAAPGTVVDLHYKVSLDHEEHTWNGGIDGVAFARDWGVFYAGRTFVIMNGKSAVNISIDFELPAGWRVTSGWTPRGKNPNHFTAANNSELAESMFLAGTHGEFSVKHDSFELVFALGGSGVKAVQAEYQSLAKGVLDDFIKLMGGIPNPPPSRRFTRAAVIINEGKNVDGEVIGNHISMILDPAADQQTRTIGKFIFAHEFFHLWNGKSINVADTTEDWFKEGVTSYYTLRTLNRIGAISEADYLGFMSGLFYGRYASDPAFGKRSIRDVASGADKDKHWGLIYGGGLFAGMCQDIKIREATENRKSLDDVMRRLFTSLGGTDKTYTTDELRTLFAKTSGSDHGEFFRRHIFGHEPVPIAECLESAGFTAKLSDGKLTLVKDVSADQRERVIRQGVLGK